MTSWVPNVLLGLPMYGPQDGVARQQKAGLTLKQLVALEKYIARADDLVEKAVAGQVPSACIRNLVGLMHNAC